jgi:hypothetical protein
LLYGRYTYCGQFYLPEVGALRGLDHYRIDSVIEVRRNWSRRVNFGGSWRYGGIEITDKIVLDLHGVCDFLLDSSVDHKIVLHSHHLYVYTNDVNFIERLARTGMCRLVDITQVMLSGTPGTVVLKNPVHKLRSYFSRRDLDSRTRDSLKQFLIAQSNIRLSPALQHWIGIEYRFTAPYFFIDHDDAGTTLMLNMIAPGLVRKTLGIEAAK